MRRAARLLFFALPIVGVGSQPCLAQSLSDPWGGLTTNTKLSSQMKVVCSSQSIATTYAGDMLGYHVFDTGGGERISIDKENALAEEIISRASITEWTYTGWSGGSTEGRCMMRFALTMAPQDAAHFNNDPLWGGDVIVAMTRETGEWRVRSFTDNGAKSMVSGWLTAWQKERDRAPGGAPRLTPPLSPQQLAIKVGYARSCGSHWEISDDLFPAYNAWLEALGTPSLSRFRVGTSGRLEAGRLISSSDQAIVCRYNIGTGIAGGNVDRSIHDLDMRFTVSGGRARWEVVSFPYAASSTYSPEQIGALTSRIYVNGKQLKPLSSGAGSSTGTSAASDQYAGTREITR